MTHDTPPRITLDQVDDYSAHDMPSIDSGDPIPNVTLDEAYEKDVDQQAMVMLRQAFLALRGQGALNFLNPLMLEDNLTIGEIAGRIHCDPRDLKYGINVLSERGIIRIDTTEPNLPRYTLLPEVMSDTLVQDR